jgi:distribution and morphology protein 34
MSFSFQWPRFSDQFHADAIEMLNAALNKGPKPPVIADKIEVVELEMGTQVRSSIPASRSSALPADHRHTVVCQPPELEIRDIGDLTTEQFRGIFRLTYSGDAYIVLRTKVQVRAVQCFMPAVNPPFPPHTRLIPAHETHLRDKDSLGGRTPLAYIY